MNKFPNNYQFHFLSQNSSLTTSTIYFDMRNPGAGMDSKHFLGSIEFIRSEDRETCFELVYSSEKRKIDAFAGFIEEPDEDFPYEFSTVFTSGGIEYTNYHLVDVLANSKLFHVTLLSGFSSDDIQAIRQFNQGIDLEEISPGLSGGDVLDIEFEESSIKDSVGLLKYLN